jgi:aspartyl/asparaginyl-tRNA synthetase
MFGPFSAQKSGNKKTVTYNGNRVFAIQKNVQQAEFSRKIIDNRLHDTVSDKRFYHMHRIDNGIFFGAVEYFKSLEADWCNLPLTTLMISSPGEVYAGKKLDYTTDTLPVDISWFDNDRNIFLSESSQFYLELRLLIDGLDKVFSIYNSFRKEKADYTHLSEFQHIEFEGKVSFEMNITIATDLLRGITEYLLKHNSDDLGYFLSDSELGQLGTIFNNQAFERITFKEALSLLEKDTGESVYKEFSLKHFGSWEEVRLTELLGKHAIVTEFPMEQIPFYHNVTRRNSDGVPLAENADIILYGYRETIGSGTRIIDPEVLQKKAELFNLPPEDYGPYLQTRNYKHYQQTSGFGMGWQRYVHWLLKLPHIWEATHIPRGHHLPKP